MTRRSFWASSLFLVSVLLYVLSAVSQSGRAAPTHPAPAAIALFWAASGCLAAGILALVSAFRARRRLRVRLGLEPPREAR